MKRTDTFLGIVSIALMASTIGCSIEGDKGARKIPASWTNQQGSTDKAGASGGSGVTEQSSKSGSSVPASDPTASNKGSTASDPTKGTPSPTSTPPSPAPTPNDPTTAGDPSQSGGKGTPIDVIAGKCRWFDPAKIDLAEVIPGGPANLAIPLSKFRANGRFESGNFLFPFKVYENDGAFSLTGGRRDEVIEYVGIIMDANMESCYAVAAVKEAEGRGHGGCFATSTMIRMGDGSERPIALIKKGDMVFNPMTKTAVEVIRVVEGPEATNPMYRIGNADGVVTVTQKHPFLTVSGLKTASQLRIGDKVMSKSGSFTRVTAAERLAVNPQQIVRNITLGGASSDPSAHMVIADGVVSGDLFLQQKLEQSSVLMSSGASRK